MMGLWAKVRPTSPPSPGTVTLSTSLLTKIDSCGVQKLTVRYLTPSDGSAKDALLVAEYARFVLDKNERLIFNYEFKG